MYTNAFDAHLSSEISACKNCLHSKLWVKSIVGLTCCQCGLTETKGIHPGYFRTPFFERAGKLLNGQRDEE